MEVIFLEDGMISVGGSVIPMDSGMYCLLLLSRYCPETLCGLLRVLD